MDALNLISRFTFTDSAGAFAQTSLRLQTKDIGTGFAVSQQLLAAIATFSDAAIHALVIEEGYYQPGVVVPNNPAALNNALVLVFNTAANTLGAVALPYCNFALEPCDPLPSAAQPLVDNLLVVGCDAAGAAFTGFQSAFTQRDFDFTHHGL